MATGLLRQNTGIGLLRASGLMRRQPAVVQRNLTDLSAAGGQHYTSAAVSPDTIQMDVYPLSDNTGLPTGAPAVTANRYQTISFAFSGSISEWGKNGADFFDGIIANVRAFSGGLDLFNGQGDLRGDGSSATDGVFTRVNLTQDDTSSYTQDSAGDWLGEDLVTDSVWASPFAAETGWTFSANQWALVDQGATARLRLFSALNQPDVMRLEGVASGFSGDALRASNTSGVHSITADGAYSFDITPSSDGEQVYRRDTGTAVNVTLSRPTLKRLLRVA